MQPTFRANVEKMNQMPKRYIVYWVPRGNHFKLKKFWTRISNFKKKRKTSFQNFWCGDSNKFKEKIKVTNQKFGTRIKKINKHNIYYNKLSTKNLCKLSFLFFFLHSFNILSVFGALCFCNCGTGLEKNCQQSL